jgi:MATE family multidrug resistance protein
MARPKMGMAIQVTGLLLKIPLNTLFVFGGMSIPEFGDPGCALATFVIVWLILRFNPFYKILHLFGNSITGAHWKSLKALLALGIPVGLNYFIEVTSFTFMALFIARLGVNAVAGHQIVANFSGVLYMLPLSLASATSTLVAQSIGAR